MQRPTCAGMTLHSESFVDGVVAITYCTVPSVPSILYVNFAANWIDKRLLVEVEAGI